MTLSIAMETNVVVAFFLSNGGKAFEESVFLILSKTLLVWFDSYTVVNTHPQESIPACSMGILSPPPPGV